MKNINQMGTHILVIGPGPNQVGGVATFVTFLIHSSYLNQNFSISHMDTSRNLKDQATAGRFSLENLHYLVRQSFNLCRILASKRIQITHLNITAGLSFWKTLLFTFICRAFGIKTLAHVHGGAFNIFFDSAKPFTQKLIIWGLDRADVIVVLSSWWKEYLQAKANKPLRIVVIPNAPDESFFNALSENPTIENQNGNTILFVGSIGKRKGIFDILKAIPLVTRVHATAQFVFLGDEEIAGEREEVTRICQAKKLDPYVKFLGWVTGDELRFYYQHADIFILPSHAENLPFSLLEAMAMGLPCITTPVGAIPEIICNTENGYLIQPGNEMELAEKILVLLKNPSIRRELGQNARSTVEEYFSPEYISKKWASLYWELS